MGCGPIIHRWKWEIKFNRGFVGCEPFAVFDMTHWKDEAQYKIDATKRVFTDDAITFYGSLIEPKPF
jgi:hypothetical protein